MKNYLDFLKYLIFALLMYLIGMIVENPILPREKEIDVDKIKHFESILHKKETQIEKIIEDFAYSLKLDKYQHIDNIYFLDYNYKKLEDNGLAVLIFKNDTLVFWTDNSIPLKSYYPLNNFNDLIHKFDNAWYEIRIKNVGYYKVVGLIKIKEDYPFTNKYLRNEYQKDFGLPSNVRISNFIVSNSFKIKDKEGEIIMCLIPHGTVISSDYNIPSLFYLLFIIYLNVFLIKFIFYLLDKQKNLLVFLIIAIAYLLRYLSIKYQFPKNLYSLELFWSEYYASSYFFNTFHSLGDFFANILLIYISYIAIIRSVKNSKQIFRRINFYAIYASLGVMFFFNNYLINSLIKDSALQLNLTNIIDFNFLSYVVFINIILSSFLFVFSVYQFIDIYKNENLFSHFFGICAAILSFLILNLLFKNQEFYYLLYLIVFISAIVFYLRKQSISLLYFYLIFVNFLTLYLTDLTIRNNKLKKEQKAKVLITQLFTERDNIAELLFKDIVPNFSEDNNIIKYIKKYLPIKAQEKITQYLEMRYFKGYWKKYTVYTKICLQDDTSKTDLNCRSHYNELFQNYGIKIDTNLNVYFVKDKEGKKFYLVWQPYELFDNQRYNLYIQLLPKLYPQNIGYPELLLDENIKINKFPEGYSYAEYSKDMLISKRGEYNYPLNGSKFFKNLSDYQFIIENNWKHIVLHAGSMYYVLSYKEMSWFDKIVSFSYLFLGVNIFFIIFSLIVGLAREINLKNINFRTKLIIIILSLVLISFLIVAIFTFNFNLTQFRHKHYSEIRDKLKSLSIDLKFTYRNRDSLPNYWDINKPNALTYKIHHLAEVFNNDINIFSTTGNLIATSRPEIFLKNIIGTKINYQALKNILLLKQAEFIHQEAIGKLVYFSAYIPLINKNNQILAIINLPYFANSEKFHKQQTNLLATLLNIYVVLFVFSIILGMLLAEQIISPLNMLAHKFGKLEIGKYEKIDYKRYDEIGKLIKAYNDMVEKLDENIKLLAKSERESAWRDMAKQIAHEIKNPLTPMQLSMQMLLRAWEDKDQQFEERLKDTAQTLIEQIDVLRRIAEQFSEFAKIPQPKNQKIDIIQKLKSIVNLFKNTEGIKIIDSLPSNQHIYVNADEEFITRIFINIIKNAIQAIPKDKEGIIEIGAERKTDQVIIWIKDNGIGISDDIKDKLFTPHFTTKSSGMGIGLNMVKNLAEAIEAKVWFVSAENEGTTFFVSFKSVN